MISPLAAERVYEALRLDDKPSAFQIRYGGCKGMLTVNPRLDGEQIVFRESMRKFDSSAEWLGILKYSKPRSLYLNRPLITILEQIGVSSNVFLHMQMLQLQKLSKAFICECEAINFIRRYSSMPLCYRSTLCNFLEFCN